MRNKMQTDEEVFNSATKGSPDEEMFNSRTKETPHQFTFYYSLDLPSSVVQRFPTGVKKTRNRVWLARVPDADIVLFDTEFTRPGFELRCVRNERGEVLTIVKNLSEKKLVELRVPGRDKISLGLNEQAPIESDTVLSVPLLTLIIGIKVGDVDCNKYEFTMNGLNSENFNALMLKITQSGNNPAPQVLRNPQALSASGHSGGPMPQVFQATGNVNYQTPHAFTTSGLSVLPSPGILTAAPSLSNSWPTSSFTSQTRPKELYSQYSNASQIPVGPNNLDRVQSMAHQPFDANIHPQYSYGLNQTTLVTFPDMLNQISPAIYNQSSFQDLHPRGYERSNSTPRYANGICIYCSQQQIHPSTPCQCQQNINRPRCASDSRRMEPNWHSSTPRGELPVAPPIGSNYVNVHACSEDTPHSFNYHNMGAYTEKQV